jgi:hypothetical protein
MAGVGVPQGMGASMGYGGSGYANTQQAVMGADNKLQAYDPSTMARTLKAPTPSLASAAGAGMTTQGLPTAVSNWLAQGGTGVMPGQSSSGDLTHVWDEASNLAAGPDTGTGKSSWQKGTPIDRTPPPPVKKTTTTTAADPNAGMTAIPFNAPGGYNPVGGGGGNLPNSGFYNPQLGYDAGPGTPQGPGNPGGKGTVIGGPDGLPSLMSGSQMFTDGKGGYYYKDASGKYIPLTGLSLQAAQGVGTSMGYK